MGKIIYAGYPLVFSYLVLLIANSPFSNWNAGRLAAGVSIAKGYKLYYGPVQGPVLDWMYGPMGALFYVPTALISDPSWSILFGTLLSQVILLVPIYILFKYSFQLAGRSLLVFFSLFVFLALQSYGAGGMLGGIHVDPPATGFALLSALALIKALSSPNKSGWFFLASVFCGLSVWSKQTMMPLPFALLTFLWFQSNYKTSLHFLMILIPSFCVLSAGFLLFFGAKELFFDMITYPASFGWYSSLSNTQLPLIEGVSLLKRFKVLLAALMEFFQNTAFFSVLFASGLFLMRKTKKVNTAFYLFFLIFLFELPMGLISRVKYGGSPSNYGTAIFFYLASIFCIWLGMWSLLGEGFSQKKKEVLRLVEVLLFVITATEIHRVHTHTWRLGELFHSKEYEAFSFSKKNPGTTYFPWYPLATLLGEDRLYHWEIGVGDRTLARYTPSSEHFRSIFPPTLKYVAIWDSGDSLRIRYFPEFSERVELPGLPGWTVFTKPESELRH